MTDLRQHLAYTEEHIGELEYELSRLEQRMERVKSELSAKKHARDEIKELIAKERIE